MKNKIQISHKLIKLAQHLIKEKNFVESDINSIDDLKIFYDQCAYGLIDFDADKPWKQTHQDTQFEDWENEWKLLSVEQLLKYKCGICFDTAKMNDYFLNKWNIQHINLFAFTKRSLSDDYNEDPTHSFTVYKDVDNKWKWLQCSWKNYKNNDWIDYSSDNLIKRIGKALANDFGYTYVITILQKFPNDGVNMNHFFGEIKDKCYNYQYEINPDKSSLDCAIDLCKNLSSFEFNIVDYTKNPPQKSTYDSDDDFKTIYKFQSPSDTLKFKCGTCWDVAYCALLQLEKLGYYASAYWYEVLENETEPNHMFVIICYKDLFYIFEASMISHSGIYGPYCSIEDIFNKYAKWQWNTNDKGSAIVFHKINTFPQIKSSYDDFINDVRNEDVVYVLNKNEITQLINKTYEAPYTAEQMREHGYSEQVINKLENDTIHSWRMATGIELIHIQPTKSELIRIWNNWKLMTNDMKKTSDKKCEELFGVNNKSLYRYLIQQYKTQSPQKGVVKYPHQNQIKHTIVKQVKENIVDGKVYHGSPLNVDILLGDKTESYSGETGSVFVSPFKGIVSCFIIDKDDIINKVQEQLHGKVIDLKFGFDVWNLDADELRNIPETIGIHLNIRGLQQFAGESTGYIYTIDYNKYKDKTHMFWKSKDSDVEFLIEGDVEYINREKVTVKWTCISDEEEIKRQGEAKVIF